MASRDKKPAKPSSSRAGGIRTLSDLNRHSGPDSDSDSDTPQEYYTGGEKRSSLSFSEPLLLFFLSPSASSIFCFVIIIRLFD